MGLLMKLKNGDTSLKSLKFGNDRPGGGDSGQPYIQTSIEGQAENTSIDGDGIIRGGLTAPSRALEDSTRLTKYLFDFRNPNGLLFTVKQNLLSRIAAKPETATGPAYGGFSQSRTVLGFGSEVTDSFTEGNGAFNEGIYTPLSTIIQAQVGYLGQHLNKMGLDPTGNFENAAIKKYGDVVFEKNKADRNGQGPIRSIIPFNLIRREQRAGRQLERAQLQQSRAENRAIDEQNRRPEDRGILFGYSTEQQIQESTTPESLRRINKRLEKWDAYRDQQTQKRLDKKNAKVENAEANKQLASQRVGESYEENFQEVYYDNRLLNLWDSKGLNPANPIGVIDSVIYSYGGGPNSAVGIGQTNINFATLNDGITPARTGYSGLDPYNGDYRYSTNNPIIYSTLNIFGDPTNPNSVTLKYLNNNPSVTERQMFGLTNENYLIDRDNSENLQPWLNGNYVRSLTGIVIDSDVSNNVVASTWNGSDFTSEELNKTSELKQDFRRKLVSDQTKSFIAKSPDYLQNNFQNRFNIGKNNDPGQRGDRSDYVAGKKDIRTGKILGAVDTINTIPVYRSDKGDLSLTDKYKEVEDFCEFKFAILDTISNGNDKFYLHFRAYLDGFKDDYKAKYNNISYLGRGEEFFKYGGYSRDISFNFKVVALSKQELLPLYRKLNFLASSLAPSYTKKGYMGGTITEVTVGSYLFNQPGIITSMNISVPEESPWEIGIVNDRTVNTTTRNTNLIALEKQIERAKKLGKTQEVQRLQQQADQLEENVQISDFRDPSTQVMPYMVEVSINFTPIHNFRVQAQYGDSSTIMTRDELEKNITDKVNNIDNNTYGIERYINLINKISDGYVNTETPLDNGSIKSQTLDQKGEIDRFGLPPEEVAPSDTTSPPPGTGTVLSNQPSSPLLGNLQQQAGLQDPTGPGSGVISYP